MAVPTAEPAQELTVDELARRSGTSVRNIRFYTGRGLLPPPRLRGRTGLYGADHLARLELVNELSALGFTLAAIEQHLRRLPTAAGAEALALHRALLTPWLPEQVEVLERAELDRRTGRSLIDDDLAALAALGVLECVDDDRVRVHGHAALATGLAMLDSGLPASLWGRAHRVVERHTTALAEELMALFQDEVLQPYRERGHSPAERARLAAALSQLKPLTIRGVVEAFGRAVNRTIRERLD